MLINHLVLFAKNDACPRLKRCHGLLPSCINMSPHLQASSVCSPTTYSVETSEITQVCSVSVHLLKFQFFGEKVANLKGSIAVPINCEGNSRFFDNICFVLVGGGVY
mgnify:FL=1